MFIALYRWKLKAGQEDRFRQGWRLLTEAIYWQRGSLGSRLHRVEDGTWIGYAQWPDRATWQRARETPIAEEEARALMQESIEESYTEIQMEVVDDLLKARPDAQESSA